MSRSGFRNDRVQCNCENYDQPHRYDPSRCQPGFNSVAIMQDQGREVIPARKVTIEATGWICSSVPLESDRMCGAINPFTTTKCKRCGK